MGTICAPLVAELFLFCYKRDFMLSLSNNNQPILLKLLTSDISRTDLILIIVILNIW